MGRPEFCGVLFQALLKAMEALLHPVALRILCEWKGGGEDDVPVDLLALLVDGKSIVDYEWMDKILYMHKKTSMKKDDRIRGLKAAVEARFRVEANGGNGVSGSYLLNDLDAVSKSVAALVRRGRKKLERHGGMERTGRGGMAKKDARNSSMLEFVRIEDRKKPEPLSMLGPFVPICFDEDTVVGTPTKPIRSTVRTRKEMQSPRRLSFIKLCEYPRPPFYGFREERVYTRNSLARLPQVLDYDDESGWEEESDVEEIASTEESEEEEEESSCGWIDSDAENVEPSRSNKRPSLSFPSCKFNVMESFSPSWDLLPLVERDMFPEELLQELRKEMSRHKDPQKIIKRFGSRYVIKTSVVGKKVEDLGLNAVATKKLL